MLCPKHPKSWYNATYHSLECIIACTAQLPSISNMIHPQCNEKHVDNQYLALGVGYRDYYGTGYRNYGTENFDVFQLGGAI